MRERRGREASNGTQVERQCGQVEQMGDRDTKEMTEKKGGRRDDVTGGDLMKTRDSKLKKKIQGRKKSKAEKVEEQDEKEEEKSM